MLLSESKILAGYLENEVAYGEAAARVDVSVFHICPAAEFVFLRDEHLALK